MTPSPDLPIPPASSADGSFDRELEALRDRLRAARSARGACPPWEELRDDLLPGGGNRTGRAERLAHRDLCPYCDAHVGEWERSLDRTSDTLGALEKGVARGVVAGARKIAGLATRSPGRPPEAAAPAPAPPPVESAPSIPPIAAPATYVPPAARPAAPSRERRVPAPRPEPMPIAAPAAAPARPLRLLVVEIEHEDRIPQSVFLCAAVLEAQVAAVSAVESLGGDPDLDAVCGIIFAGPREPADWPAAVRRARDLVPGTPVVVLAGYGTDLSGGAKRTLGAVLLSASDPAEHLLLALDARLR